MDDGALSRLYIYMTEHQKEPEKWMSEDVRKSFAYSKWIAEELYERLSDEFNKLPEFVTGCPVKTANEIVEEFIDEMDTYATQSESAESRFMFSIAGDEARRIAAYICR